MDERRKQIINGQILSDRALRYRRNVIALAVLIAAAHFVSDVDLRNPGVFGFGFKSDEDGNSIDRTSTVLLLVWLVLGFNATMFAIFAHSSIKSWIDDVTRPPVKESGPGSANWFVPEIRMMGSTEERPVMPSEELTRALRGDNGPSVKWEFRITKGAVNCPDGTYVWGHPQNKQISLHGSLQYMLPTGQVFALRRAVRNLKGVDIGVPVLAILVAATAPYLLDLWHILGTLRMSAAS